MIDYSNQVYTKLRNAIKTAHGASVKVSTEYVQTPAVFPCVTIDEIFNAPGSLDSGVQKYSDVTYRVQIFANGNSKRADARRIFKTVSDTMYDLNLMGKTFTTTPEVYNSDLYEIQATFEGLISKDGVIFRR